MSNVTAIKKEQNMETARYNIDTCSLLVELNTSVWTARKLDKSSTDELVHNKQAGSKDAARVNKHLLAGRKELEVITQHVGNLRNNYFYPRTLPWTDSGLRLLPTAGFMDFNERMQEEEEKFWVLVKDFIAIYPTLITAQAMALGQMFNRADFPIVSELERKFAFSVNYLPVPSAGDFRIDVGDAAAQELRAKFVQFSDERVSKAMEDVRLRLREHLERMSDRLTIDVVGGEVKPRKFHDTLLDNGLELCDLVKTLNLAQDPQLEAARKRLEQALVGVDSNDLRKNAAVRRDVKTEVDAILKGMTW